jgi:hypothetical protein
MRHGHALDERYVEMRRARIGHERYVEMRSGVACI